MKGQNLFSFSWIIWSSFLITNLLNFYASVTVVWNVAEKPGAISWILFPSYSNSIQISFCSLTNSNEVITIKFCTWQDSSAVVPCAKFDCYMKHYYGVTLKPIFHWIRITMEKSFMKWAPGWYHGCWWSIAKSKEARLWSKGKKQVLIFH